MTADYDYDQLFPGRFLKSGEFKGKDVTLTISDVKLEDMEDKRKGTVVKCIVSFKETKRQLVLNKTNGECLKGMFGRKVATWVGKKVTFYPENVRAFGASKLAIRVKGSPDIAADMNIVCQIGTDSVPAKMVKTGQKQNGQPAKTAQAPAPADLPIGDAGAEPPPDMDATAGEVPFN